MEATAEELSEINDIGPIVANSIREFFLQDQTKDLIEKIKTSRSKPRKPRRRHTRR